MSELKSNELYKLIQILSDPALLEEAYVSTILAILREISSQNLYTHKSLKSFRGKEPSITEEELMLLVSQLEDENLIEVIISEKTKQNKKPKIRKYLHIKNENAYLIGLQKDERLILDKIETYLKQDSTLTRQHSNQDQIIYSSFDSVTNQNIPLISFFTKSHHNQLKGYLSIRLFKDDDAIMTTFRLKKEYLNSIKHVISKYIFKKADPTLVAKTEIQLEKEIEEYKIKYQTLVKTYLELLNQNDEPQTIKTRKVLILGSSPVYLEDLKTALKKEGYQLNYFEFCLDYEPAIDLTKFLKGSSYLAIICGPLAHKLSGVEKATSLIAKLEQEPNKYIPLYRATNSNKELKLSIHSVITEIKQIEKDLRIALT